MRILVISDTHGDFSSMQKAVNAQPTAEVILHCGDGEEQVQFLKDNYKDKMIVGVRGNCDWNSFLPTTETLRICNKTILLTHGHIYNAKSGLYHLFSFAKEQKADILAFGHTHNPICVYEDGIHLINPGSCSGYMPSYGYIDITDKGEIVTNTVIIK